MMVARTFSGTLAIMFFSAWTTAGNAQENLFDRDGAVFSAIVVSMTYLGAAQGIIESCGADVEPGATKMIEVYNLVEAVRGQETAKLVGGLFGTGMAMTENAACNVDNLRTYENWANFYIEALQVELRQ